VKNDWCATGPLPDGREYTLLRRWKLAEAGVCDPKRLPGARLCLLVVALANMLFDTERRTVDVPKSARFPPEEDLWKFGCAGRWMLWLIEVERICCAVKGALRMSALEDARFIAD